MRVGLLAVLAVLPAASHAYTEGWQPGQSYTKYLTSTSTAAAGASVPTAASSANSPTSKGISLSDLKSLLSLEEILTKGPVSRLIQKFGFNVTAQLEMAREGIPPRFTPTIPLLSDANYEEDLLNEQYSSPKEADERVWAIMCSIGTQDPVSSFFDRTFDGAHNLTVQAGDLKNVRWARIDYLEVTDITTRWGIWKAPVLVIAKDQGRELRFFKVSSLREMREPEEMRDFLLNEEWAQTAPWSGPWSPTGNRHEWLAKYAKYSTVMYNGLAIMPRWLLLLITGTIASTAISFLHSGEEEKEGAAGGEKKKKALTEEETPEWVKAEEEKKALEAKASASAGSGSPSKAGGSAGVKKRKGGKK